MIINYINNTPEGKARLAKIEEILPKETLLDTYLYPKLKDMLPTLTKMLYAELEIYKQYPKIKLKDIEEAKKALKTFDPRNSTTCFQGKAFKSNDNIIDADLNTYRKAVGTFHHAEWGNATLLEIWGGDHFEKYPKMVKNAFKYGANLIKNRPILKFHVNPLFMNKKSGKTVLTQEQQEEQDAQDLLFSKALIYGVREPKKQRR